MIEFSISDDADQKFSTVLNGRRVTLRFLYSEFANRWSMDVSIDDAFVLHGKKVVSGTDLLSGLNLEIGVIFVHSEKNIEPGRDELPNGSVKIYHATQDEINASVAS